jgi:hypothetical protein
MVAAVVVLGIVLYRSRLRNYLDVTSDAQRGNRAGEAAMKHGKAIDLDTRQMYCYPRFWRAGYGEIRDIVESSPDFSQGNSRKVNEHRPPFRKTGGNRLGTA